MAITREAYGELGEALGAANVSDDPGVIQSYSYMHNGAVFSVWWVKPACVVLPGSREDVQSVIEVCNRHDLKFQAFSTGWMFVSLAWGDRCVLMDLRRMNSIEVNERDGYAVIDPYITGGEQQAEIMRYGLNCHIVGAGPNCSNLASATSMQGTGGTAQSMSCHERSCLAVEWVLPTGELLYLGSIGTPEAGWFCGDGPGPSLRGMMRGAAGSGAANGVKTRIGLKCYPWYPEQYKCYGSPPFFESQTIENSAVRLVRWEDNDGEADGLYRISEGELTDYCVRTGPGVFEECLSCSNEEYMRMVDSEIYRRSFPRGVWLFSMIGSSRRDIEYRLKAFQAIVDDTNGIAIDPADMGHDAYEASLQTAVRDIFIPKAAFMPTGAFLVTAPLSYEAIDQLIKHSQQIDLDIKKEWLEKGAIEDDYVDNIYFSLDEHGHYGHIEAAYHAESWEPQTEGLGMVMKGTALGFKAGVTTPFYTATPPTVEAFLTENMYYKKMLNMLDPCRSATKGLASFFTIMGEPLKSKIGAREKEVVKAK